MNLAVRLWIALAESEQELGLPITDAQLAQMREKVSDIDFARVAEIEKQTRHDVMAHIRAYGEVCPEAAGIIHLGATSCYVTDNADMILIRDAFGVVRAKLVTVIRNLAAFAEEYKALPCLAYIPCNPRADDCRQARFALAAGLHHRLR